MKRFSGFVNGFALVMATALTTGALLFSSATTVKAQTEFDNIPKDTRPPLEEYNNWPPGLLLSEEAKIQTQAVDPEEKEINEKMRLMRMGKKYSFQTCQKFYREGRYDEIVDSLELLSSTDNIDARELLGIMHRQGQGVEKNIPKALKLIQEAAEENRPMAQHHLGIMYYLGEGLEIDKLEALMWLHIAVVHYPSGDEKNRAIQDRETVSSELSRREREIAFQKARAWLDKKGEAHLLELP